MFSPREKSIINIIGKKQMTIEEISVTLFKEGYAPFDSRITVSNSIRRIIKKCDHFGLSWTFTKKRENFKLYIKKELINE